MNTVSSRNLVFGLVWILVIFLDLSAGYFNAFLLDAPFTLLREIPFTARWIVWIPLTPLALFLARKMSYAGHKKAEFVAFHLSIYLLLCTVHIFMASLTAKFIKELLGQPADYVAILKKCTVSGIFYNFIIYGIIVLLINGLRYYRDLQAEKMKALGLEKSLADNRLQFLKQQLQPHFLFNTHHSIITLIKMGEKEKAAGMLEQLSGLMRVALRESDSQKVTLQKEIETLDLYIGIQKVRFGDRLGVDYALEPSLLPALVPGMILQPLVENAIKYAIEPSVDTGKIGICASKKMDQLILTITDWSRKAPKTDPIKWGTGLSNSAERLIKLYGGLSTFSIESCSKNDLAGMAVTLSIPLQYE